MYNYNLIISIFSKDNKLIQTIKSVKAYECFNNEVKSYENKDIEIIKKSDIVIWDLDSTNVKNLMKEDSKLIVCLDKYDESYKDADGIILKPINYEYAKFVYDKVLNKISLEEKYHYTDNCLNTAINGSPDMFWVKSNEGIHTLLNDEFCNVVGKTKEDVTGRDHYYIWNVSKNDPNSGADICKMTEDQVIAAGHTLSFHETVKNNKGVKQLITYKSPLYDKNGDVIGTVGFGHDITELKNMSIENQILLNSVPYPVLIQDKEGRIQEVNHSFEVSFGITKNEIIGVLYSEWADKTFLPGRTINEGGFTEGVTTDNKTFELRFNNICDVFDNIIGKISIFRDVTLERRLESQIIENANIDFMTNLYNRRYLDKFVSEQKEGETLTLLATDLDHFKLINDTYGHKTGDEAIILTAKTLKDFFPNDLVV